MTIDALAIASANQLKSDPPLLGFSIPLTLRTDWQYRSPQSLSFAELRVA